MVLSNTEEWILIRATTQTNLRCVMLSQSSQSPKAAHCRISSFWHSGKGKTISTETDQWLPGAEDENRSHKGAWEHMKDDELFPILTVVVVIWLYVLAETHRTVHTQKEWIFLYVNYTSIKKILMRTISSPWWGATERFIQHVDSLNGLAPYHSLQLAW